MRPDRIVHMASISNTEECEKNPVRTIDMNGRLVAVLCDILVRNSIKCKLFNASSSEIYKGHGDYTITDNDNNMSPTTMYAVCKTMGHRIVDSYRNRYNLPFSNGVIFTTESRRRSDQFLFKKVALHAKQFKKDSVPLTLGALDSWRNLNHAEDVAEAIRIILDQPFGSTYVICGTNFNVVEEFVVQMYAVSGIILKKEGNCYVETTTGKLVITVGKSLRSSNITKINGVASSLNELDWAPRFTAQAILEDLSDMS